MTIDIIRSKISLKIRLMQNIKVFQRRMIMTKKKINVLITIMIVFIVLFLAGSFAYENYLINKQDQKYEESLKDLDNTQQESSSGKTSEESK